MLQYPSNILIIFIVSLLLYGCGETKLMFNEPKPLSGELKDVFEIEKGLTEYALTQLIEVKNTLVRVLSLIVVLEPNML